MRIARHLIGILIALVGIACAVLQGGNLASFLYIPAFFFTIFTIGGLLLFWEGGRLGSLVMAIHYIRLKKFNERIFLQAKRVLDTGIPLCYAAAFLGMTSSIIQFLVTLDDPCNWLRFPLFLASFAYSIAFYWRNFLCAPCEHT